jgi:hypothetical protein
LIIHGVDCNVAESKSLQGNDKHLFIEAAFANDLGPEKICKYLSSEQTIVSTGWCLGLSKTGTVDVHNFFGRKLLKKLLKILLFKMLTLSLFLIRNLLLMNYGKSHLLEVYFLT